MLTIVAQCDNILYNYINKIGVFGIFKCDENESTEGRGLQ